jgi:hypothetical protein
LWRERMMRCWRRRGWRGSGEGRPLVLEEGENGVVKTEGRTRKLFGRSRLCREREE